ncbi:MAG TPA: type II toxin-antitoxin system VapB family antitoxin [Bryobacteraceae bacterium]|nr:type II toxin-antitoxin system VapB family antitoxin [Bryobacteraceae bacterium]
MALNIKNREVERLAAEVAAMTHETKTQAIRRALEDRKAKLEADKPPRRRDIRAALEKYIWPYIPAEVRGKKITKEEREEILGYGPDGV